MIEYMHMQASPDLQPDDFRELFDILPDQYQLYSVNEPFYILAQNNTQASNTWTGADKPIGLPLLEAYPDVSDEYKTTGVSQLVESIKKAASTGKVQTMPLLRYDVKGRNGKFIERHWRVSHYPLTFRSGKLKTVLQTTQDVTDEIESAASLRRSNSQLSNIVATGNIGTWQWDLRDGIIKGDKNFAVLFGIAPETAKNGLLIEKVIDSIYPEDQTRISTAIERCIEQKTLYNEEHRTVSEDGSVHWVSARGQIETDNHGDPMNFVGVLIDITETKRSSVNFQFLAEVSRELSSSLDLTKNLRMVADLAIPDIADWCTIDLLEDDGSIKQAAIAHRDPAQLAWAKEYSEQQGVESPTLRKIITSGKSEFYPVLTDEMLLASAARPEDYKLAKSLELNSVIIVPLATRDGVIGTITLILTGAKRQYNETDLELAKEFATRTALAISNARLYGAAAAEILRREKLEIKLKHANEDLEHRVEERTQQLQTTNQNLERSNQELQEFAYVASHDLQEPLRKIQAFGDLLITEYDETLGEGKLYLERMRSAAARMSTLIQDLLSFSRVTTHAKEFVNIDLTQVYKDVIDDLETRIHETGGIIHCDPLPAINGDPVQLRQLFQNLIGNALKFYKPNKTPHITISAENAKNAVILTFSDDGVGFDQKYADRIFSVFQRLHGREVFEGTGIGLAICRKIVERHGGGITAAGRPGKGAVFTVTLPKNAHS